MLHPHRAALPHRRRGGDVRRHGVRQWRGTRPGLRPRGQIRFRLTVQALEDAKQGPQRAQGLKPAPLSYASRHPARAASLRARCAPQCWGWPGAAESRALPSTCHQQLVTAGRRSRRVRGAGRRPRSIARPLRRRRRGQALPTAADRDTAGCRWCAAHARRTSSQSSINSSCGGPIAPWCKTDSCAPLAAAGFAAHPGGQVAQRPFQFAITT